MCRFSFHYLFPDFIWDGRIIKTEYDWTVVRDFKWNLNKNSQNWPISLKVLIKNVWMSDKSWEPRRMYECFNVLKLFVCKLKSDYLSCLLSHVIFHISHVNQRSNAYFDPWYMLSNFCFHVYAQKSLIIGENGNDFFWPPHHHPILLH